MVKNKIYKGKDKSKKHYFSTYEIIWLISIIGLGVFLAILLPDEEIQGKALLTTCSFIALISGVLCELLISKQSKWNFIVSIAFVEITDIIICLSLGYYASAGVTLLFWVPVDIISYVNWNKHIDEEEKEVTKVRKFTLKQDILVILLIIVFSAVVGYLLELVGGEDTYIDALTSAFGIANGLFILYRYREQWIAWYLYTIFEAILWILSGSWIMLVLSLGYLTNTTYGYIKWTKYIKSHTKENETIEDNSVKEDIKDTIKPDKE